METLEIEKNKIENNKRGFIMHIMQIKKHVNLQKMLGSYIQHGKTCVYTHSRNVAYLSYIIARFFEKTFNVFINYDVLIARCDVS